MGSRNIYIKNRELDNWVLKKIAEDRFRNYSHAVEVALKLLKDKEEVRLPGAF